MFLPTGWKHRREIHNLRAATNKVSSHVLTKGPQRLEWWYRKYRKPSFERQKTGQAELVRCSPARKKWESWAAVEDEEDQNHGIRRTIQL